MPYCSQPSFSTGPAFSHRPRRHTWAGPSGEIPVAALDTEDSHYKTLGLPTEFPTPEERRFKKVAEAYEVLSDKERSASYRLELHKNRMAKREEEGKVRYQATLRRRSTTPQNKGTAEEPTIPLRARIASMTRRWSYAAVRARKKGYRRQDADASRKAPEGRPMKEAPRGRRSSEPFGSTQRSSSVVVKPRRQEDVSFDSEGFGEGVDSFHGNSRPVRRCCIVM
ncbi:hypothetical protein FOZ62_024029 [Perkinsus olseni]|uniref:J domain-containing protein n=1 Tax=Perkinsus olseni TaxID=32597 RepID=A0A7J6SS53_PEROL|nr:hypothetical protein FOZ62_024029 [Perkinsus olseni]